MRVRPLREHVDVTYDLMIVASLVPSELLITRLVAEGVPHDKLLPLRQDGTVAAQDVPGDADCRQR